MQATSDDKLVLGNTAGASESIARRCWQRVTQSPADLVPLAVATAVFAAIVVLVAPWGNFPLNDDWVFARVVKGFLETGRVKVDTGVAPALVGQTLLAAAFSKVVGFSHVGLRILTMLTALVTLIALNSLLSGAKLTRRAITAGLVVVVINPLFINLSFSFMTECYGYSVALVAAALWFRAVRYKGEPGRAVIGVGASLLVGLLMGGSFWIRQYCILAYPAVLGATALRLVLARDWKGFRASLPAVSVGIVVFVATVRGYFAWAKYSGNLNPNFAGPLSQVLHFTLLDWLVALGIHFVYLTAFLLPLLLMWPRCHQSRLATTGTAAACLLFALCTYSFLQLLGANDASALGLHRVFPFESNIIHNHGIGPITLSDTFYWEHDKYPVLAKQTWERIGAMIIGASVLWALPIGALRLMRRATPQRVELLTFGLLFSFFSLAAVVQSYGTTGFDRYILPIVFGGVLALTTLLSQAEESHPSKKARVSETVRGRVRSGLFGAGALLLAFFTVAGVHDYFRWNEARWSLVGKAMASGVPSTSIDGGYEVNGWLSLDAMRKHQAPREACIRGCRCTGNAEIWSCFDDSYRVWMSVAPDYDEVARIVPTYWLGRSRPVILSRRRAK